MRTRKIVDTIDFLQMWNYARNPILRITALFVTFPSFAHYFKTATCSVTCGPQIPLHNVKNEYTIQRTWSAKPFSPCQPSLSVTSQIVKCVGSWDCRAIRNITPDQNENYWAWSPKWQPWASYITQIMVSGCSTLLPDTTPAIINAKCECQ